MILLALAACGDTPGDSAPASPPAPAACDPFDIVQTGFWEGDVLPATHDVQGTQPGVALGDLDGDGFLDAFFAYAGGSMIFRNDGTGALVDEPAFTVDGGAPPWAMAVALADLDADGDLDAHIGRWFDTEDRILWNDGTGAFTSEPLVGSTGTTFASAFADADADGDLDLFVGAGAMNMTFEAISAGEQRGDPNLLYFQEEGGFVLGEGRMPEDTLYGITFQGAWLDADADGDLDLYVANDAGPFLEPNHLLLNDGAGTFTRAEDCDCALVMFAMGAAIVDPNGDGAPDIYITDVGSPNLLVNQRDGTFADATLALGADIPATPESMVSWGVVVTDLNADRYPDLVVTFGRSGDNFAAAGVEGEDGELQPDVVLLGRPDGTYTRAEGLSFADPSRTRAVAMGDLDRDGRPDLVTAGKHFLRSWRTTGGCAPGLTLSTNAGGGDVHGIGARVTVEAGGVVTHQWMLPGATGSSNAPELYFGLAGAETAERVTVRWLDGTETVLTDVPAGPVVVAR